MIEYQYASNKGQTQQGDPIANPFGLYSNLDGKNGNVDANFTGSRVVETIAANGGLTFAWDAAVAGTVEVEVDNKWVAVPADRLVASADGKKITGITAGYMAQGTRVRYVYDNVVVPQNDLPMIKAEMKSIALVAKARRIAVKSMRLNVAIH